MITASLISFVSDFKLLSSPGTIVFEGDINFSTAKTTINVESKIQVNHLNVKQLDVIYLLNPAISKQHIPDMVISDVEIGYWPYKTLFTNGTSPVHGAYTLMIMPSKKQEFLTINRNGHYIKKTIYGYKRA